MIGDPAVAEFIKSQEFRVFTVVMTLLAMALTAMLAIWSGVVAYKAGQEHGGLDATWRWVAGEVFFVGHFVVVFVALQQWMPLPIEFQTLGWFLYLWLMVFAQYELMLGFHRLLETGYFRRHGL